MTMSMATKAHGTAAMGGKPSSSAPGALGEKKKTARRRTAHEKKDTASNRSARVSWRRLSSQKMAPTAKNSKTDGTTTGATVRKWNAFAAAHRPRTPAVIAHGTIHGLRCAYSCAPRKKNSAASA